MAETGAALRRAVQPFLLAFQQQVVWQACILIEQKETANELSYELCTEWPSP